MQDSNDEAISILTIQQVDDEAEDGQVSRSMFSFGMKPVMNTTLITEKGLAANLSSFISLISPLVEALPEKCGAYYLDQLNLSLAVDGEGKISLVGELSWGLSSAISISLKRRRD